MTRPLRIEYPGAHYHVTSRGNARQRIFNDDSDRELFLDILENVVERYGWICHAYCLMDNHYHLLIETPEGNLSRGMRQVNGVYTQKYNWKYRKTGHIFQGRYKAIIIDKDSYLLELCRYVALNPVRAGIVQMPEEWPWSSYRFIVGLAEPPSFLVTDWVLEQFDVNRKKAQKLFSSFVCESIQKETPWKELKGQIFLGDDLFIQRIMSEGKAGINEIPRLQRLAARPLMNHLFTAAEMSQKDAKDAKIYHAHTKCGYTLKEIADYLGVHYSTVSRSAKRGAKKMLHCKT